ncbi:MAG: hypothetical protein ACFB16_17090 [Phormidesmis sp.]
MTAEQLLVNSWRNLPANEQQQVIDFVEFLRTRHPDTLKSISQAKKRRRTAPPELVGSVQILGDIISPIVEEEDWECGN